MLWAMEKGRPVHYHGQVSPMLLAGLEDIQRIWQRWRPGRYRIVAMTADEETAVPQEPRSGGGLFAFSGGVDGAFSLFRHLRSELGRVTITPRAALLVQGFDIPPEQVTTFESASRQVAKMLEPTGVPLLEISSDFRRLGQHWEDSFGLGLAACMLLLQRGFMAGVQGSGEPYETLVMPWGSTPLTDPLISTESFRIRHDGADCDRTQKVAYLARVAGPAVTTALRVCWEGEQLDRNCGRCEKCIRTAANFWAAGVTESAPERLTIVPASMSKLRIRNEPQMREMISVRDHATARYERSDLTLKALNRVITTNRRRIKAKTILAGSPTLRFAALPIRASRRVLRRALSGRS